MNDVTEQTILAQVTKDIEKGLEPYFDDGQCEQLSLGSIPSIITSDDVSVVVWKYKGLNSKPINNVQPSVELDENNHPKNKTEATWVAVEGVTILHHPADGSAEWGYHRFIDWNSIAGQIGTSRGRATAPGPIEKVIRAPGDTPGGFPITPDF